MLQLVYDGTMAGLLSAIFEAFGRKSQQSCSIVTVASPSDIFASRIEVQTDALKARRVWNGLQKKLPSENLSAIWHCYLSELPEAAEMILRYTAYVFEGGQGVEQNFGHTAVLWVSQTAKKVWREKHRMEAFVRFQELQDGLFYAPVAPDFNVLPLISKHFQSRYPGQDWLIYDSLRKYGLYYSRQTERVDEVHLSADAKPDTTPPKDTLNVHEELYQLLWQDYFKSTGIEARTNRKLHLQHIPKRYWKHLTEKWR